MKAEAERRKTQGLAGDWEMVGQPTSNKANDNADTAPDSKKREAEGPPDPEDTRSFKLRKKVAPPVTDNWDADLIPIKLKKAEEVQEPLGEVKKEEDGPFQPAGAAPIKWTSRGWKRPEDEPDGPPNSMVPKDEEVKAEPLVAPEPVTAIPKPEMKEEPKVSPVEVEPPAGTVGETGTTFRKRKFLGNRGKR